MKQTLFSWGRGRDGALGRGSPLVDSLVPEPVPSLSAVAIVAMSAGASTSLAVSRDEGKLYTWGNNHRELVGPISLFEARDGKMEAWPVRLSVRGTSPIPCTEYASSRHMKAHHIDWLLPVQAGCAAWATRRRATG